MLSNCLCGTSGVNDVNQHCPVHGRSYDIAGWYYLHTNGELIFKRREPEIEPGGFVRRVWPIDPSNRMHAWCILIEAGAMGANPERIKELSERWNCDDADGRTFVEKFTDGNGALLLNVFRDGNQWCATFSDFKNLQESKAGFGDTILLAVIALVRACGCRALEGRKMVWPERVVADGVKVG